MALINGTTKRIPIPHEPEEWVELRQLTGAEMDEAQEVATTKVMERMAKMLPLMKDLPQSPAQNPDAITTRRAAYDPETLLRYGVAGWSYDEPFTIGALGRLDAVTRDWLWEAIVEANTRPPVSSPGGGRS